MAGQFGTVDDKLVRGVNWAPDSCDKEEEDQEESPVPQKLVRGVNWAPDSDVEEEEDQQEIAPAEENDADVGHALMQQEIAPAQEDDADVVHALMQLAETEVTKFQSDKEKENCTSLLLPVYLPRLYGQHEQHVHDASVTLFWIGRGLVHGYSLI
jgi:hypothetical protein